MSHDDPDNSGQCIHCRVVLDPDDEAYDDTKAEGFCHKHPKRCLDMAIGKGFSGERIYRQCTRREHADENHVFSLPEGMTMDRPAEWAWRGEELPVRVWASMILLEEEMKVELERALAQKFEKFEVGSRIQLPWGLWGIVTGRGEMEITVEVDETG